MKTAVLITTYNRGNLLKNSLERMCNLTKADEYIIVDDGSSDNTKGIVDDFLGRLPIKYIYNHNPTWSICSMARNIGIKNTDADLIITTEPELIWVTDVVPIILEEREKYPLELISAGIIYHAQTNAKFNPGFTTDPVTALKSEIIEEYQTEPRSYHPNGYCKTTNMQATFIGSYERKWLMEVGGWDEQFPGCWGFDDIDLATRLRVNGINQHICERLEAIHQWHPHPDGTTWAEDAHRNDIYFKNKNIQDNTSPFLIANQGKDWGVVKTR